MANPPDDYPNLPDSVWVEYARNPPLGEYAEWYADLVGPLPPSEIKLALPEWYVGEPQLKAIFCAKQRSGLKKALRRANVPFHEAFDGSLFTTREAIERSLGTGGGPPGGLEPLD